MRVKSTLRRRRLMILLVVAAAVIAGIGALYAYQRHRLQAQTAALRQAGLEAYEAGAYNKTLDKLSQYLTRREGDAQTLYAYAKARLNIPRPNQQHLPEVIESLEQVQQHQTGYKDTAATLMRLYRRTGQAESARGLAQGLLEREDTHRPALRNAALANLQLDRSEQALDYAQRALKHNPKDLRMHLVVFDVRRQRGEGPALVQRAAKLRKQHPDDSRFAFLQAYAHAAAGEAKAFERWIKRAAANAEPSPVLVRNVLHLLDQARFYREATAFLAQVGPKLTHAGLRRRAVMRLYEAGRFEAVLNTLDKIDPKQASPVLVAHKALARYRLGDIERARTLTQTLGKRNEAPLAQAWASVLQAAGQNPTSQARQLRIACQQAIENVGNRARFHALLGDAYAGLGELTLAIDHWRQAAEQRPAWARPRREAAAALLELDRPDEARRLAQAAFRRRPNHIPTAAVFARAQARRLSANETPSKELLELTGQIVQRVPRHRAILPLHVRLLARANQTQAAGAAIDRTLEQKQPLGERLARTLAEISERYKLGKAEQCRAAMDHADTLSPKQALARAKALADKGKPREGRSALKQYRKQAGSDNQLAWQLAEARFADTIDADDEKQQWHNLADAYPERVRIQRLALQSDALQNARSLRDELINRLRDLTGDDSFAWRLARARYLLHQPGDKQSPQRVIDLLKPVLSKAPDHVDARLLLAAAHEQAGNLQLTAKHLRTAIGNKQSAVALRLHLAKLYQRMRSYGDARASLQQAAEHAQATRGQKLTAARLLAKQGATTPAIAVLEAIRSTSDQNDAMVSYRLARLYARSKQPSKAMPLCDRLLNQPPTPRATLFLARFYAKHDNDDKNAPAATEQSPRLGENAQQAIDTLDRFELDRPTRLATRADFRAAIGHRRKALSLYQKAANAASRDTGHPYWRSLVRLHLRGGETQAAFNTLRYAQGRLNEAPVIDAMLAHEAKIKAALKMPVHRPLVLSLLNRTDKRTAILEAVTALGQLSTDTEPSETTLKRTADQLTALAKTHSSLVPLRVSAANIMFRAGRTSRALDRIEQTMRAFPRSAQPAKRAAKLLSQAGRWSDALAAANAWQKRTTGQRPAPDAMRARALLAMDAPSEATGALKPHVSQALQFPDRRAHAGLLYLYGRSVIADGEPAEARKVFLPLLKNRGGRWRDTWLHFAIDVIQKPTVTARWLEAAAPHIKPTHKAHRLTLCHGWWQLAKRTERSRYRQKAENALQALLSDHPRFGRAWLLRGRMAEARDNFARAERMYRKALKYDGPPALAKNNLAYALIQQRRSLDEALKLARAATEARPNHAAYHDTLARAYKARGNRDRAIEALQKAVDLAPDRDAWQQRLDQLLEAAGGRQAATDR